MVLVLLALVGVLQQSPASEASTPCTCRAWANPGPVVIDPLGTGATATPRAKLGRLVYESRVPTWTVGHPILLWIPENLGVQHSPIGDGSLAPAHSLPNKPLDISYQLLPAQPGGASQTQGILVEAAGYKLNGGSSQWVVEIPTEGVPAGDYWLSFSGQMFMPIRLDERPAPTWDKDEALTATWWTFPDSTCPIPIPWLEITGFQSPADGKGPLIFQVDVELDGVWSQWGVYSPHDGSIRLGDRDGCEAMHYDRPAFTATSQVTQVRVYQWGTAPDSGQVISRLRSHRNPRRHRPRQ